MRYSLDVSHTVFLALIAALTWPVTALAGPTLADDVPQVNCPDNFRPWLAKLLIVQDVGPLRPAKVFCQRFKDKVGLHSPAVVSPDGESIAYQSSNQDLVVARLDRDDGGISYPARLGPFKQFAIEFRSPWSLAWSDTSQSVWTANVEAAGKGLATYGMQPMIASADGQLASAPAMQHSSGPLDALLWAGGKGLAVAQFGVKGDYYRPEHADNNPMLAIVDVAQGKVLETLAFKELDTLLRVNEPTPAGSWLFDSGSKRKRPPLTGFSNAAAAVLPDGRVRVLLFASQWVIWTQGERPRLLPNPYAGEVGIRLALSPDGTTVLVNRLLRPSGVVFDSDDAPPPIPREGVLVAAHDLVEGKLLWSIRATTTGVYEYMTPAISPDGRYALVDLMPEDFQRRRMALVDMKDGATIQAVPGLEDSFTGFANGGRTVWMHSGGITVQYHFSPGAR